MTVTDKNAAPSRGPIPGFVVGQFFGIFHGADADGFAKLVAAAPFEKCNLLVLAFVRTVPDGKANVADFTNWREDGFVATPGDMDTDRVDLVVKAARARNGSIKILVSLGWSETTNDVGLAAATPGPFADSVAAIVHDHGLDGFDIDYESADASADDMLALARHLRKSLDGVTPKREMILTITPAQQDGLNKHVLQAFTYVMPQSYDHGGNGTKVDWYKEQLGSFTGSSTAGIRKGTPMKRNARRNRTTRGNAPSWRRRTARPGSSPGGWTPTTWTARNSRPSPRPTRCGT